MFVLKPDLLPHPAARTEKELKQERNIAYVGDSRPRHRLYYVSTWPFDEKNKHLTFTHPQSVEELTGQRRPAIPLDDKPVIEDDVDSDVARHYNTIKVQSQEFQAANAPDAIDNRLTKPVFEKRVAARNAEQAQPKGWEVPDDGEPF